MSKNKIEILALIDRSGSMLGIMDEAVGAFNAFIEKQRELSLNDKVKVTLASFDNQYEVIFDRVKLAKVPKLTVDMVEPRGMTALYDSIGKLITGAKHPKRDTIMLIQTDGFENSSTEYDVSAIKRLITLKESTGWEVNFVGAGIDAVSVGKTIGISPLRSHSVDATVGGMDAYGASITAATTSYRAAKSDIDIDITS